MATDLKTRADSASKTHPERLATRSQLHPRQPSAAWFPPACSTAHQLSVRTISASASPASPHNRPTECLRHTGWHQVYPASSNRLVRAGCDHLFAVAMRQKRPRYCGKCRPTDTHTPRPHRSPKPSDQLAVQSIRRIPLGTGRGHQSSERSPAPNEPTSHAVPRCASSP